ncbi:MAG: hypothetical protein ACLRXQ_10710 [Phascolarctobacterium faecium]
MDSEVQWMAAAGGCLAEMASECCNVIRFNFNGSQILSKQVEELEAVLAYVRIKFSAGKIFLLGRSLGGAAALVAASRSADITGLVLWAAPNDLQATFRNALGAEAYNALSAGQTLYLNDERGELTLTPDLLQILPNMTCRGFYVTGVSVLC